MKNKIQKKANANETAKLLNITLDKDKYNENDRMMEAYVYMELEKDKIYKLLIVDYSGSRFSLPFKNTSKLVINMNIPEKEGNYKVNITLGEEFNDTILKSDNNHTLTANLNVKYGLKHKIKNIKITNINFKFGIL